MNRELPFDQTSGPDVVVIGGGPAGLSATLTLARCRRSVVLCDAGTQRNVAAETMWAFPTREGLAPDAFRRLAREELERYPEVSFRDTRVVDVRTAQGQAFEVLLEDGGSVRCRKLLIATGLVDVLPQIDGLAERFGHSVFQCPYCDAYEFGDAPIAYHARGRRAMEMGRALTAWSRDVLLCPDGPAGLSAADVQALARNGVRIDPRPIASLQGEDRRLERIVFRDGGSDARHALFFDTPSHPQSALAERLGCVFNRNRGVRVGAHGETTVKGVYVAGNILRDVQLSIVAAAEGTKAAFGINRAMTREDFLARAAGESAVAPALVQHDAPSPEPV